VHATGIVHQQVTVIVAAFNSTAAIGSKAATSTIPIVFLIGIDTRRPSNRGPTDKRNELFQLRADWARSRYSGRFYVQIRWGGLLQSAAAEPWSAK